MTWYDDSMNRHVLHKEAEKVRNNGYSYNMIGEKLGIAKSTLSNWFKAQPFIPNTEAVTRNRLGPIKSAQQRHNRRVEETQILKEAGMKELGILSKRDLWLLGLGLYLGEGTKAFESIRIINSNPEYIKLGVRWFKEVCGLNDTNITIAIHLYPDNDEKECLSFWSTATSLPLKNFRKTQIDRRINKNIIKKKKLPYGTAHLMVISNGEKGKGVNLYRRIAGWMEGALSQI